MPVRAAHRGPGQAGIMEFDRAREIIACLPRGRTLFHYFADRYALYLLSRMVRGGRTVAEIKASRFAKLLQRPAVRALAAAKGDGMLRPEDLDSVWAARPECYLLTLGTWGPEKRHHWNRFHHQTSRPGVNLVLQLNFSALHNKPYRDLIRPGERRPFESAWHPIARRGFHTLAWARLDVDLDTGEALVEEVQTDWLRFAADARQRADHLLASAETRRAIERVFFGGVKIDPRAMRTYFDEVLDVHLRLWDEALLTAVLWFLAEELGVRCVFYHDFDCGCRLKGMKGMLPPRSLYTRLPQRFCFDKVQEAPEFMSAAPTRTLKTLARAGQLRFWRMEL